MRAWLADELRDGQAQMFEMIARGAVARRVDRLVLWSNLS